MGIFLENNFKQAEANRKPVTLSEEEQERCDRFEQKCEELRLAHNGEDLRLHKRDIYSELVFASVPVSPNSNQFAVMFMLDCRSASQEIYMSTSSKSQPTVHITYNVGDTQHNMTISLDDFINMDKYTVRMFAEASRMCIRQFNELEEMRAKFKQNKAETKKELKRLFK